MLKPVTIIVERAGFILQRDSRNTRAEEWRIILMKSFAGIVGKNVNLVSANVEGI
jgi:hypothetical protein